MKKFDFRDMNDRLLLSDNPIHQMMGASYYKGLYDACKDDKIKDLLLKIWFCDDIEVLKKIQEVVL